VGAGGGGCCAFRWSFWGLMLGSWISLYERENSIKWLGVIVILRVYGYAGTDRGGANVAGSRGS
jgi:hypothetical protein